MLRHRLLERAGLKLGACGAGGLLTGVWGVGMVGEGCACTLASRC